MALSIKTPNDPTIAHRYLAFGLVLSLPFPAPQLTPAPADHPIDIQVVLGPTPPALAPLHHTGYDAHTSTEIQISPQGEMLWTTHRARFWASGGTRLVVEPLVKLKPASVRHFVLYVCLATLLNQRGLLALHANAVVGSQGAIVFSGRSGAGKSTLLAALMARGLPMLADDLTVIETRRASTRPTVLPGYPSYRLCSDALTQFTPVADHIVALGGTRNKHMLYVPKASLQPTPVHLHALYILNPHAQDHVAIRQVVGLQAFQLIQASCFDPTARLLLPHALPQLQHIAQSCAVYQIDRPMSRWSLDEIVDLLLATQAAPTAMPKDAPVSQAKPG